MPSSRESHKALPAGHHDPSLTSGDIAPSEALSPSIDAGRTPLMAQYHAIKAEYPDALLFYRMGDFYELFFADAVAASAALDIALTKRGKHLGEDIPMCGVPVHSHETYLARLIRRGFKVAVCEQTEDPVEARKRGAKAVVRRDVVRLITPGTLTEDTLLDARRPNYLAAIAEASGNRALAWIDISTGEFAVEPLVDADIGATLARLDAGEILTPEPFLVRAPWSDALQPWRDRLTPLPATRFDSVNGRRRLERLFNVGTLDAFGAFSRAEVAAAGALVDYVDLTQRGSLPRLASPRRIEEGAVMAIDAATRRNLELIRTLAGDRQGSLLGIIDRTVTGGGARQLQARLAAPSTRITDIDGRLDGVQFFVENEAARSKTRELLRRCPDIERALARLTIGRGGPRDLANLRDGLALTADLRQVLAEGDLTGMPPAIREILEGFGDPSDFVDLLSRALAPEPPLAARDGDFIASGYSPPLDEMRRLRAEGRHLIVELQGRYASETGITTLKIRHNNLLGYFIEVPAKQAERLPAAGSFLHRQTMAGAVRYTTLELADLERRIASAAGDALAHELELFAALVARVSEEADGIARAAASFAALDVAQGLATLAEDGGYVRPLVHEGLDFDIAGGRHPVVEAMLAGAEGERFVANDCRFGGDGRLWLLTGPNMAGKSTFLRQNALIAILAQMGSYVPADAARIGVVDRLFSRVGAADEIARGRSTFMVEMVETAAILNQAGKRALVILDEIGRGTATFDGLAIAWAVVEHLVQVNRCRALFATHYHELTALASRLPDLTCMTMRVKEWHGDVIFLHQVVAGAADRSYGIHVGRLAGLPGAVIARAEEVLAALEAGEAGSATARLADDLPLFAAARRPPAPSSEDATASASLPPAAMALLDSVHVDDLTPREALDFLYRLKELIQTPVNSR